MAGLRQQGENPFLESTHARQDPVLTGRRDPAREKPAVSLDYLMRGGTPEDIKGKMGTWVCEDPESTTGDHTFQAKVEVDGRGYPNLSKVCSTHPKNKTRFLEFGP